VSVIATGRGPAREEIGSASLGSNGGDHEVSILMAMVVANGRWRGWQPGAKASMMITRPAADPRTCDAVRARLQEVCVSLDLVALLRDIRSAQQRLADLADVKPAGASITAALPIDLFLASLRTAWQEGASRPTDRPILKAKRGHRRPDPLVHASPVGVVQG
jgi:hypothetical protein